MDHHYRLLIETPEADLSTGMQGWGRPRGTGRSARGRGAVPLSPAGSSPAYRPALHDDQPEVEETMKLKT